MSMIRPAFVIRAAILGTALCVVGSLPNSANAAESGPTPAPVIVHVNDFAYKPPTLTIVAGTSVTFINDDDYTHTVTAIDKVNYKPLFDSGNIDKGEKWTHTFTTPGTFKYICAYHDFVKATIVVRPAPTPS